MKRKGFTLIELLIVVLIIAILAAIAVPNFLEFQVRAKVSRAMSDMRSMATAIEAYVVDYSAPPLGFTHYQALGRNLDTRTEAYGQLTTPVAYISSVPQDPFNSNQSAVPLRRSYPFYSYELQLSQMSSREAQYDEIRNKGFVWSLTSHGPDQVYDTPYTPELLASTITGGVLGNFYDPTNGTVSKGNLFRTNKGVLNPTQLIDS